MLKKGFTLAEILIVLVIIGTLTAILLPIAFQSSPDENVMKFKKAYNTIGTVIRELVSSDEYYQDGDLGIRKDGQMIDGKHDGDNTYFCESFADVVSAKSINCHESSSISYDGYLNINADGQMSSWLDRIESSFEGSSSSSSALDTMCLNSKIDPEIIFVDGVAFYQLEPECTYGITRENVKNANKITEEEKELISGKRLFNNPGFWNASTPFDSIYKVFCFDVDGVDSGEAPFGIGIRADGKIYNGARVNEWLDKSIQNKD